MRGPILVLINCANYMYDGVNNIPVQSVSTSTKNYSYVNNSLNNNLVKYIKLYIKELDMNICCTGSTCFPVWEIKIASVI